MNLFGHYYRRPSPGEKPGIITVQADAQEPRLNMFLFGPGAAQDCVEKTPSQFIDSPPNIPFDNSTLWVNVAGLGNADFLHSIGKHFDIHPLILEDIASASQRPKVEEYDQCLFIVLRVPVFDFQKYNENFFNTSTLTTQQISICIGKNFILTFQEKYDDLFNPIRNRLMQQNSRLSSKHSDYLAYAIIDYITDMFFPIIEKYGEYFEDLELSVEVQPTIKKISNIHKLKRELLTIRRIIWPQREMINKLIRDNSVFIFDDTKLYLRDCYDHTVQLVDIIETYREMTTGLVDILLSAQNNRLNEIMKVLTIIATIFIPLSWISGIYGMNFNTEYPWNMPELTWKYGYLSALLIMVLVAVGLLLWFWRKGWIGQPKE